MSGRGLDLQAPTWHVWLIGFCLWLLVVCNELRRRGPAAALRDLRKDARYAFWHMQGFTLFLYMVSLSWYSFLSNLAVGLSQHFPTIPLFVLYWVFMNVEVVMYLHLVLFLQPPRGWQGADVLARLHVDLLRWASRSWLLVVRRAWTSTCTSLQKQGRHVCRRCSETHKLLLLVCLFPLSLALGLYAIMLAVMIYLACIATVLVPFLGLTLWCLGWPVIIVLALLLRIVICAVGFVLYQTNLLSFPMQPQTRLFWYIWARGEVMRAPLAANYEEADKYMTAVRCSVGRGSDRPHFRNLAYQGVNVFYYHFHCFFNLFLASISRGVIQVVCAANATLINQRVSSTLLVGLSFSLVVTLLFTVRYGWWLVLRPCKRSTPQADKRWKVQLAQMHIEYFNVPADASPAAVPLLGAQLAALIARVDQRYPQLLATT